MNKNNKRVFHISEGDMIFELPIIGEEVRMGDTVMVESIDDLQMTFKQIAEYLFLLDSEGIIFKSTREPCFDLDTPDGKQFIHTVKKMREASKRTLSNNSRNNKGSGRPLDSNDEDKAARILGMWSYTDNKSKISREAEVSRNLIDRVLERNGLK